MNSWEFALSAHKFKYEVSEVLPVLLTFDVVHILSFRQFLIAICIIMKDWEKEQFRWVSYHFIIFSSNAFATINLRSFRMKQNHQIEWRHTQNCNQLFKVCVYIEIKVHVSFTMAVRYPLTVLNIDLFGWVCWPSIRDNLFVFHLFECCWMRWYKQSIKVLVPFFTM